MSDDTYLQLVAANDAFYDAFASGDYERMDALWARESAVSCDHPGVPTLRGRNAVMDWWRRILERGGAPGIYATDVDIEEVGDAYDVRCMECIGDAAISAVNTFVRESGDWRITAHRAAPD